MRYPLFADLTERRCLVVGGGAVATRKIRGLLDAGAVVTVVAPETSIEVRKMAEKGQVEWIARAFEVSDVQRVSLVFVATNDPTVNQLAVVAAKNAAVWVNAADDPTASDFHLPALVRSGPVTVAVASEGSSPALSAWLRDRVADALPGDEQGLTRLARLCDALRTAHRGEAELAKKFRQLFDAGVLELLARQDWEATRTTVDAVFGPGAFTAVRPALMEET